MDIKESLEQQLKKVVDQFEAAEQKRKELLQEAQNIFVEELKLQGEHRCLLKLVEDLKKND